MIAYKGLRHLMPISSRAQLKVIVRARDPDGGHLDTLLQAFPRVLLTFLWGRSGGGVICSHSRMEGLIDWIQNHSSSQESS